MHIRVVCIYGQLVRIEGNMKYADILAEGEAAFASDEPRNANPYPYHSVAWYAWDNGWSSGRAEFLRSTIPTGDTHAE